MAEPPTPDPIRARERQQAAEDIFESARTLPEAARDAVIDAATQDAWVRAEVRSLLRFDGPTIATHGGRRELDPAACLGLSADGFTLRRVIGVGGMGTVFEADQQLPARKVAFKVLHGAATRASAVARFRKESEFLARLDHPHIARVISAGTLHVPADGTAWPYFAMELVPGGRSITRWARESGASRREIAGKLATACDAVGSGHRLGVIHLDLKPGNLLVSEHGTLRVIDYGIARSLEGEAGAGAGGSFAGTPQYMSPEQLVRGAHVDSRADVYALGLILFELLTDRVPYDTRGAALAEVASIVSDSTPVDPRLVDSTVPGGLAAIAMKALSKRRDDRYGTASEMGDDIRRWLADEPLLAERGGMRDSIRRLIRRNRPVAALIFVALAAIAVGAVASVYAAIHATRASRRLESVADRALLQSAVAALRLGDLAEMTRAMSAIPAGRAGWEFRHLAGRASGVELLARSRREILRVASIPATDEVVIGLTGGFVGVVDAGRRTPGEIHDARRFRPEGQSESMYFVSVAASPDGQTLLAATNWMELLRIDRATGAISRLETPGCFGVRHAGERIVGATPQGGAFMLDAATGAMLAQVEGAQDTTSTAFAADGSTALVGLVDGTVRCLEFDHGARTIRERWRSPPHAAKVRAVAVTPDGNRMVGSWSDARIARLDPRTGSIEAEAMLPGGRAFALALRPDGALAVASGWSNELRIIDASTLRVVRTVGGTTGHVWEIAFSPDGSRLFGRCEPVGASGPEDTAQVEYLGSWRIDAAPDRAEEIDLGEALAAAAAEAGTHRFVLATAGGEIRELDPRTGVARTLGAFDGAPCRIARDGGTIAVGTTDGRIVLLEAGADDAGAARLTARWEHRAAAGSITALAISPDRTRVLCGHSGNRIDALDAATGSPAWTFEHPLGTARGSRASVLGFAFLEEGRVVTAATVLVGAPRVYLRTRDGATIDREAPRALMESDGVLFRGTDDTLYAIGVTGSVIGERGRAQDAVSVSRTAGVACLGDGERRLFLATSDGFLRVIGFDPVEEIVRLPAPPGIPLAVSFDDASDRVTTVTTRGLARSWSGRAGPPAPVDAIDPP